MGTTPAEYKNRINKVIDYINEHLDQQIPLDVLAGVASFSPFHFHRIFKGLTGETLGGFVKRLRLEKAANILAANPRVSVTEVAFSCGFSTPASFARAFKERFGCSATEWRKHKGRGLSKNCKAKSKNGKDMIFDSGYPYAIGGGSAKGVIKVEVKEMPSLDVAYVRSMIGYGDELADVFDRLFRWAGPRGLVGPGTTVLGIPYDNPDITPAAKCRYDACITVPQSAAAAGEIGRMRLESGRYAVCRFEGTEEDIAAAYNMLYGVWLPENGYQPDDRLSYEIYYAHPRSHPEKKFVSDICIPVKPL
ncbi:MAG: GyrI-like domain-containing protein [Bacillota bacterium]